MKVATMRIVDRWFGVPLCIGLTAIRKLLDYLPRRTVGMDGGILFVKLAEQGSTVLANAAIRRAVDMVGAERVYFLVFEENRFIVDALGILPEENVITINAKSFTAAIVSSIKATGRLRSLSLRAAVDMEFFARSSAIFTYLSGARQRVGFHPYAGAGSYRGDLLTHRLIYNPHLHTSQVFYSMVEALSRPESEFPAQNNVAPPLSEMPLATFEPDAGEIAGVEAMIRDMTGLDTVPPLILLNANCSDLLPVRRWPTENYTELARRLLAKYDDLHIGFTGAPDERIECERVAGSVGSRRCLTFAGRTTLRQLLALYSVSRILVTNDSGPAHFATLTPIEVIGLFGPETPKLFAPPSPRSHVMWSGLVCSPCVSAYNDRVTTCRNNLCMQQITVDAVFEKTCEVYEASRQDGSTIG